MSAPSISAAGRRPSAPAWTARALSAASGASALGCQMAWTQQAGILLGHEAAAVLAVVTAFMVGLAAGALAFGERVARSAHPLRSYVLCELLIGAWAALSPGLVDAVAPALLQALGPDATPAAQWAGSFAALTLLWLPATAAMGVALPAMDRLLGADGRQVAGLYAANTAGALAGVVLAVAWLMPEAGLRTTARLCGLLNLGCALLALWRARDWPGVVAAALAQGRSPGGIASGLAERAAPGAGAGSDIRMGDGTGDGMGTGTGMRPGTSVAPCTSEAAATLAAHHAVRRRLALLLAFSGLLGIGVEVLAVRVLSQVAENTLYTWAALLACYLLGTALGAAAWQRRSAVADADAAPRALPWLLAAAGVLACAWALAQAVPLQAAALAWLQDRGAEPLAAALAAETWPALLAFAPATAAMGALFSHLAGCAQRHGLSLGRVFGSNTLGAAAAPPLLGLWAVPQAGSGRVAAALVLGYLAAGGWVAWRGGWRGGASGVHAVPAVRRASALKPSVGRAAVGLSAIVLSAGALTLARHGPRLPLEAEVRPTADEAADAAAFTHAAALNAAVDDPRPRQLWRREGALGEVRVLEDAQGVRTLQINRRAQEGDNISRHVDGRQAALPLLLHPAPRRVLMIGLGTGVTARAAAADPRAAVEVVELLPEVVAAAPLFARPDEQALQARLRLHVADARRHLRADDGTRWDLVIGDNVHPGRSGTAALHTVEQFRAVRARLAPGGLYCQWLPLHQLDAASLAGIVQAWLTVFPQAAAVLASHSLDTPVLGLLGRVGAESGGGALPDVAPLPAWAVLQQRVQDARAWAPAARPAEVAGLASARDVAGAVVADAVALRTLAGAAPAGTDDRPLLAWQALRVTYAPVESPRARLAGWLPVWAAGREAAGGRRLDALFGPAVAALPPEVGPALLAGWAVRDDYLTLGMGVQPSADVRRMLAQVQAPLLELLRRSPGFTPARGALERMADALQRQDPAAATALRAAIEATAAEPGAAARRSLSPEP